MTVLMSGQYNRKLNFYKPVNALEHAADIWSLVPAVRTTQLDIYPNTTVHDSHGMVHGKQNNGQCNRLDGSKCSTYVWGNDGLDTLMGDFSSISTNNVPDTYVS